MERGKKMQAFVWEEGEYKVKEMEDPTFEKDEVVVNLKTAGLNRRDLSISKQLGEDKPALVIGSDGAGVIETIGSAVKDVRVGDEVIVNPSLRWEKKSDAPPASFDILGKPDHGTIAGKIVLSENQVEPKPSDLSWEEAGVLALAGLTGYRALVTKGEISEGQTVFIPGAGSGVATFMIQFAKAKGAKVIVSSRSKEKQEAALQLGADRAIDTEADWQEELQEETIDLVIDSVGRATFNRSLGILKKGGRIVIFGATAGDIAEVNLRAFFYGQYQLFGSTMGSREELQEMLRFIKKHEIRPVLGKVFSLEEAKDAFRMLEENVQFGKLAITLP